MSKGGEEGSASSLRRKSSVVGDGKLLPVSMQLLHPTPVSWGSSLGLRCPDISGEVGNQRLRAGGSRVLGVEGGGGVCGGGGSVSLVVALQKFLSPTCSL